MIRGHVFIVNKKIDDNVICGYFFIVVNDSTSVSGKNMGTSSSWSEGEIVI